MVRELEFRSLFGRVKHTLMLDDHCRLSGTRCGETGRSMVDCCVGNDVCEISSAGQVLPLRMTLAAEVSEAAHMVGYAPNDNQT